MVNSCRQERRMYLTQVYNQSTIRRIGGSDSHGKHYYSSITIHIVHTLC